MSNTFPTLLCPVTGDLMVDALAVLPPELLNQKVLDHGHVNVIDVMPRLIPAAHWANGGDFALADAARRSYQKGTRSVNGDTGLVDHLTRNQHTSPIEMAEVKFDIKLPIFVMRQLVRHRTLSLNEESARYSELSDDFYIPLPQHWAVNTAANKQAGAQGAFTADQAKFLYEKLTRHNEASYRLYKLLLGERKTGADDEAWDKLSIEEQEARTWEQLQIPEVAREQARMVLGVNIYTSAIIKSDLKNLLHLLRLRTDAHAQFEIRCYGDPMARVVEKLFPAAWASFKDNFIDGINFSAKELDIVYALIHASATVDWQDKLQLTLDQRLASHALKLGWTERRTEEFIKKLAKAPFGTLVTAKETIADLRRIKGSTK